MTAYIDIPSSLQHVNLAPLDVTDFGLATAGDVSNVVVILNVYNTASANTWDYEAYLINNGDVITSNYASNVLHSNATTSERLFIFNANTFSKVVIESQSFGFRYRPRSDGTVRVYVGNVRLRMNNTQQPNGMTSYVQSRYLADDVGLLPVKQANSSILKNQSIKAQTIRTASISSIKEALNRITSSLQKTPNLIQESINRIVSVKESLVGLKKDIRIQLNSSIFKSTSLLKAIQSSINLSIQKGVSIYKGISIGIQSILDYIILATTYYLTLIAEVGVNSSSIKKALLNKIADLKASISSIKDSYISQIANVNIGSSISKLISRSFETSVSLFNYFAWKINSVIAAIIPTEKRLYLAERRNYLYLAAREKQKTIKQRDNIFKV